MSSNPVTPVAPNPPTIESEIAALQSSVAALLSSHAALAARVTTLESRIKVVAPVPVKPVPVIQPLSNIHLK